MNNLKRKIEEILSKIELFSFLNNRKNRDKWVIKKLGDIPKESSILDVGAGTCKYRKYCSDLNYTSQDFCEYKGVGDGCGSQTGEWDTSKIDIVSDITKIPVPGSSYDYILCTEVLEHVPYPERALSELTRILKKGGKIIITAPFVSNTHMSPFHYCTGFNRYWYEKVLGDLGFKILEIESNGNYADHVCEELVLAPLALKKCSSLKGFFYLIYIFLLPVILVLHLFSKTTKKSEQESCFGYFVVAEKVR